MAFELKPTEKHYLEVEIEGRGTSRVPLADSLTMPWLMRLNEVRKDEGDELAKVAFFYDFFRTYCGTSIDLLTMDELGQLIGAWNDATEQAAGATPGE